MRQLVVMLGMAVLLAACDHYEEDKAAVEAQVKEDASNIAHNYETNTMRVAGNVRDSIKRTANKMREWWITPLPENHRLPVAPSYCYSAYQDILCYRQPMPGWEHRLVAYQGTNAPPPPMPVMQPLPVQTVEESLLPASRVATAEPVFKELPEDSKKAPDPAAAAGAPSEPSEAHETLPDPALAPQL